ncbi:MFS transporter [Dietzia sp.]|uniref:MFS transporter n=1 Tax=Dietzia sp. TaxID=1871616 RepID=UPI002FDAB491
MSAAQARIERRPHVPTLPRAGVFAMASAALIFIFVSSGVPVPLYNMFREADGITDGDLALTTVTYLAFTALSLLLLGRLSNHLGRKPVIFAALFFAIAGCAVMTQVHSLPVLLAARMLQGLACGLASTAAGAFVIDSAPRSRLLWLPAVVTSSAPPFAIPAGALVSGTLSQFAPFPRTLTLCLTAGVLFAVAVLVALCPETMPRRPGAFGALMPRVHVPKGSGRILAAAGCALVATWSFSGFYQAFAPGMTADYFHSDSALMISVVFASAVFLAPLGGSISGRMVPVTAFRIGIVAFLIATVAIMVSLHAEAVVPFLVISLVGGLAQGAANSSGMRAVLDNVETKDRAGTLATMYLISYSGAALPGLAAGQASKSMSLPDVGTGYVALAMVAGICALVITAFRKKPAEPVER